MRHGQACPAVATIMRIREARNKRVSDPTMDGDSLKSTLSLSRKTARALLNVQIANRLAGAQIHDAHSIRVGGGRDEIDEAIFADARIGGHHRAVIAHDE